WIEVPGPDGRWMRYDPTPPSNRPDPEEDPSAAATDTATEDMPTPEQIRQRAEDAAHPLRAAVATAMEGRWGWAGAAAALAAAALTAVVALRAWRRRKDPRRALLERRADDLAELARGLGIAVSPATTVSVLALALADRTGVDLGPHL